MENNGNLKRNSTAGTGKFTYKYTDLAQIHEYLQGIGARYYQYIKRIGDDDYIMTVRIIDGQEKKPLMGCRVIKGTLTGGNPAQEQGSALTYARRYSLLMAFGLATEDDDAQSLTPAGEQERLVTERQVQMLNRLLNDAEEAILLKKYGIQMLEELPMAVGTELIGKLMNRNKGENK